MKSAGKYKIDNTEWISSLTLIRFKIKLSDNKKWVDLPFWVRFFVWTFNMSKESLRKIFQCLNSNKRPLPIAWQVKLRAIFFFKVRVSFESWPPAAVAGNRILESSPQGRDPFNQNFRNISVQNSESVPSNRKSFEKTGPPFEVDQFSRSDRLKFWLNGSHPNTLD